MERLLIELFNILAIVSIVILLIKQRGFVLLVPFTITAQVIISGILGVHVLNSGPGEYSYAGTIITGSIPVRYDYLSAWFILVTGFTFLTGVWYGYQYMKKYSDYKAGNIMHAISFILIFTSLIDICLFQNTLVFLVFWEIMALSSFILIIYEHYKAETLSAGINFLIQSHISILFLTIAFIWVRVATGSFDMKAVTELTLLNKSAGIPLFLLLFVGFAIKAGFVPFHTWLPLAHPAAPAHVSGIMSGVIIKIGIFGILRTLTLVRVDFEFIGYFILAISLITGLYGVMLAILQHNLKKLLAFHSIENIGIIGIGIGLGCLGIAWTNEILIFAGFSGAVLHTLNHSLFKSLLFFSAGNVYQATHTVDIESLGGLIKKLPKTSWLFLAGALAICGLPPFNGFVSEFIIYNGLFKGLAAGQFIVSMVMLFSILILVLIGGLALICFTKAFGIVFLGRGRDSFVTESTDNKPLSYIPMYLIAATMLTIGILPFLLASPLLKVTSEFVLYHNELFIYKIIIPEGIRYAGICSAGFILLVITMLILRKVLTRNYSYTEDSTWGCGYTGEITRGQYTASSFVRNYRKLMEPALMIRKDTEKASGMYPAKIEQSTQTEDKIEYFLINIPVNALKRFMNKFVFLQNGNIQSYILYGVLFLAVVSVITLFMADVNLFSKFLNTF